LDALIDPKHHAPHVKESRETARAEFLATLGL